MSRSWPELLSALLRGQDLGAADTRWAMGRVMDEAADPVELAGFLVALRAKGESAAEMAGLLDALMERVVPLPVDGTTVVDIVGTGGDGAHTVNVSTMAAIVLAATGVRVVKHGGRSVSSRAGSADVLEALGIPLDLGPEQVARCVDEVGIGFTFAPVFHRGLHHAAPVRRRLGVPTAVNHLAPLTNPAFPSTSLVGCSDTRLAPVLARVLADRGATALVVRGDDGVDEITTAATTRVWAVADGRVERMRLDTAGHGLARCGPDALRGGDAVFNAGVVRSVLEGERGPVRDVVLANAAGALAARRGWAHGLDAAFAEALAAVAPAVDSGAARTLLRDWVDLARSLAVP
ncbi:anthranilate phosphoribosyltransferase [Nocardiopsis tropica]|uniref:Anthranilate phosphoribosyltransferase n=1 Tax=Nocardiopsis tropica TaxID=109330 RepID=A0ABU7KP66_9ACTN|nr:anthranilate phosphoribosyltransferase [Nocardiopsis umidischolae]MEE2051090.1 anthranilate phosphoribosyltransferase [Nocardiopsis umidischolae]